MKNRWQALKDKLNLDREESSISGPGSTYGIREEGTRVDYEEYDITLAVEDEHNEYENEKEDDDLIDTQEQEEKAATKEREAKAQQELQAKQESELRQKINSLLSSVPDTTPETVSSYYYLRTHQEIAEILKEIYGVILASPKFANRFDLIQSVLADFVEKLLACEYEEFCNIIEGMRKNFSLNGSKENFSNLEQLSKTNISMLLNYENRSKEYVKLYENLTKIDDERFKFAFHLAKRLDDKFELDRKAFELEMNIEMAKRKEIEDPKAVVISQGDKIEDSKILDVSGGFKETLIVESEDSKDSVTLQNGYKKTLIVEFFKELGKDISPQGKILYQMALEKYKLLSPLVEDIEDNSWVQLDEKLIHAELINEIYPYCNANQVIKFNNFFNELELERARSPQAARIEANENLIKVLFAVHDVQKNQRCVIYLGKLEDHVEVFSVHQSKAFTEFSKKIAIELSKKAETKKSETKSETKSEIEAKTKLESPEKLKITKDNYEKNQRIIAEESKKIEKSLHKVSILRFEQLRHILKKIGVNPEFADDVFINLIKDKPNFSILFRAIDSQRAFINISDLSMFFLRILPIICKLNVQEGLAVPGVMQATQLFNEFVGNYKTRASEINQNRFKLNKNAGIARVEKLQQEFKKISEDQTRSPSDILRSQAMMMALFLRHGTLGVMTDPQGGKSSSDERDSARAYLLKELKLDLTVKQAGAMREDKLCEKIINQIQLLALTKQVRETKENKEQKETLQMSIDSAATKYSALLDKFIEKKAVEPSKNIEKKSEKPDYSVWIKKRVFHEAARSAVVSGDFSELKNLIEQSKPESKDSADQTTAQYFTILAIYDFACKNLSTDQLRAIRSITEKIEQFSKLSQDSVSEMQAFLQGLTATKLQKQVGSSPGFFSRSVDLTQFYQRIADKVPVLGMPPSGLHAIVR